MKTPFDQLRERTRELLDMTGWEGTVYNYTLDTTNSQEWYEETTDTEWTEDAGTTVTIRVEPINVDVDSDSQSGREITGQVVIYTNPTQANFSDGEGEDERASEIVDETSGHRYRVRARHDLQNGTLRLRCGRMS